MSAITLETIQWSTLRDIDDVDPLDDSDADVLGKIREILLSSGKHDRFGVCLLHKHFDLAEGEVAVEYTDTDKRVSTVIVQNESEVAGSSVQTTWRFSIGSTMGTECIQRCGKSGMTHSTVHQKRAT